jgi:hypothetical protein
VQPYVIKQGDHLALLAHKFGFDADAVWNDPANDDLRNAERDPELLAAGDVLYIPNQVDKKPVTFDLSTGSTNTFQSSEPTMDLQIKFADPQFASKAYTVQELPDLSSQSTGEDGTLKVTIPVTMPSFTVVFTEDGTTVVCKVAQVDPVRTMTGVIQRLQNLGYLDPRTAADAFDPDTISGALDAFCAAHPSDDSGPPDDSGDVDSDDDTQSPPIDPAIAKLLKTVHGS